MEHDSPAVLSNSQFIAHYNSLKIEKKQFHLWRSEVLRPNEEKVSQSRSAPTQTSPCRCQTLIYDRKVLVATISGQLAAAKGATFTFLFHVSHQAQQYCKTIIVTAYSRPAQHGLSCAEVSCMVRAGY
jgi:hypothetical protein